MTPASGIEIVLNSSDRMVGAAATDTLSNFTPENCTVLSTLFHLTDVITRLAISNEEYWGTMNTAWLLVFYIYFIVCCPLLLAITCRYLWIMWKIWKPNQFTKIKNNRGTAIIQLLGNYMMWSFISVIYQLLTVTDVNTAYPDQSLAVTSKIFELLSFAMLINGLTIIAVFEYFLLYRFGNRSVISHFLCSAPSLLIVVVVIVILLSASGSVLIMLEILILMLVIVGVGSSTAILIMTYRIRYRRLNSLYAVVITSYVLLMLLSYHLVNALVKVSANNDCIVNAKGNRVSWLVIQSVITLLELIVGYVIADFVRPWRR